MTAIALAAIGLGIPDRRVSGPEKGTVPSTGTRSPSITLDASFAQLIDRIAEAARSASVPDWDGEGAAPVEASTVEYACLLAGSLPTWVPTPDVSPDRDGDLTLEWDLGPRRVFSVSVRRDGVLHYAGLFGTGKAHGSDVLVSGAPAAVVQNVTRLFAAG